MCRGRSVTGGKKKRKTYVAVTESVPTGYNNGLFAGGSQLLFFPFAKEGAKVVVAGWVKVFYFGVCP